MLKPAFYDWGTNNRHIILLCGLIAFFILPELVEKLFSYQISFPMMLIILVASGTFIFRTTVRTRIIRDILVIALLIFLFVWSRFGQTDVMGSVAYIVLFLYFLLLTYSLFKDLLHSETITTPTIIGAFSGYILIGVMWFFVFGFFDAAYPDTFSVEFGSDHGVADMLYYSFITLTTIGYGDFTPTSALGQKLSILEGLVGHFYLAIIMAILVGMYLRGTVREDKS